MRGRRIAYPVVFLGCLVFYGFYREWFSWFALVAVTLLPWFSLLLSLPAMLAAKAILRCPTTARMGMPVRTALLLNTPLPTPPIYCELRVTNALTGERFLGKAGEQIPTDHCGMLTISYPSLYVYDYLGLFRRKLRNTQTHTIYIEPKPLPDSKLPEPEGKTVSLWRPKPGGGFSEVHDLRLYRPGDDLRHIHWKMAAKTGKLIYREPMEPAQKGYALNIALGGTAQELDQKLGRLLWASQALLEKNIPHTVRCNTENGLLTFSVTDALSLEECIHRILATPKGDNVSLPTAENALWQQYIGGEINEG